MTDMDENDESTRDGTSEPGATESVAQTLPTTLAEFIHLFYVTRSPLSDAFKNHFVELEDSLSGEEQIALHQLAIEADKNFSRTLSLAEVTLEVPGKKNHRDKVMSFIERVCSGAGSLSKVETNSIFQAWLDANNASRDKLNIFYNNIERITDGVDRNGQPRKLRQELRNNLSCIAAMWLYHRRETTLPQLINHLMQSGMNLQGEAGAHVESRAFAYVASMIKSTKRKRFAYFVDYVGRNEKRLTAQNERISAEKSGVVRQLRSVTAEKETLEAELQLAQEAVETKTAEIRDLQEQITELEKKRVYDGVHHGAEFEKSTNTYNTLLNELLDSVEQAKTACDRGPEKIGVVEYQLEEMEHYIKQALKQ